MTPEQVRNWRIFLSKTIGPYAWIMPLSEIEKIRNNIQNKVDKLKEKKGE